MRIFFVLRKQKKKKNDEQQHIFIDSHFIEHFSGCVGCCVGGDSGRLSRQETSNL